MPALCVCRNSTFAIIEMVTVQIFALDYLLRYGRLNASAPGAHGRQQTSRSPTVSFYDARTPLEHNNARAVHMA